VNAKSKEVGVSLAILTTVVLLALTGLAIDDNWPKVQRVSASFVAYVGTFVIGRRFGHPSRSVPSFWVFALAGCVGGIVSGLVREEIETYTVVAGAFAAGFLLGGMHWFALKFWRQLRSALIS
jgi:hypothetical protein